MFFLNLILTTNINEQIVDMSNLRLKELQSIDKIDNENLYNYEKMPIIYTCIEKHEIEKPKSLFKRIFCCFSSKKDKKTILKLGNYSELTDKDSLADVDVSTKKMEDNEVNQEQCLDRDSGIDSPGFNCKISNYNNNIDQENDRGSIDTNINTNDTIENSIENRSLDGVEYLDTYTKNKEAEDVFVLTDEEKALIRIYDKKDLNKSTTTLKGSFYMEMCNEFDSRLQELYFNNFMDSEETYEV